MWRTCLLSAVIGTVVFVGVLSAAAPSPTFSRLVIDSNFAGDVKGIGDIDGDGFPDLVIGGLQMNLYLHPSWAKTTIATASIEFTTDMKLVDLDADGDLDIVTGDGSQSNNVVWLENPRPARAVTSTWTKRVIGTHGDWVHDVEVGDIDRDGRIDVITRKTYTNIYFQNSPTSWVKRDISSVVTGWEGMTTGDIDRDGDIDIAAAGDWIETPASPRTGTFTRHPISSGWPSDTTAAIRDLNGDGRADVLFIGQHTRGRFAWYEAPANPLSGSWIEHLIDSNMGSHKLNVGDLNRDGLLDIVTGLELAELAVYVNQSGSSPSFVKQTLSTQGIHNQQIGDIGNDGDLDIFGANYLNNPPVALWQNTTPAPTGLPVDRWSYIQVTASHQITFGLAFGDLDSDGRRDIVSGRFWYKNPGGQLTGAWAQRGPFPLAVEAMLVVNVDGDAQADVIAQKTEGSELALYWLEATDSIASSWNALRIGSVPAASHTSGAQGYRTADIRSGNREEILISSGAGIWYFEIPANPATTAWPRVQVNANPSDEGFGTGDIDRDGNIDVVAGTGNSKRVEWYRNPGTGAGNWTAVVAGNMDEVLYPDRFGAADLNRDGRLDIVATEENGATSGARTFWWEQPADPRSANWTRRTIATQGTTNSMDLADMDADGDVDVVLAEHRGSLKLGLWLNNGSAAFTERVVGTGKESHLGARVIDIDQDGDNDLVSIAWDSPNFVHLWRNDAITSGSGADTTPPSAPGTPAAASVTSARVNLTWTASTDNVAVTAYRVFRNGVSLGTSATTSYSDTSVAPGTTYTYKVNASDAAGNVSADSGSLTITTPAPDTQAPAISSVTATNVTSSSATINWVTNEASTSRVEYGVSSGYGSSSGTDTALTTSHSVTLSGLAGGSSYHYRVHSVDASGNAAASADFQFSTPTTPPPGANGLVAHWNFDEGNGSSAADSTGAYPGTLANGAAWGPGRIGGAVRLDGTNDYVAVPSLDVNTSSITVAGWVNFSTFSSGVDQRIVSKASNTSEQGHYWMLGEAGNRLRFRLKAGGSTSTLVASSGNLGVNTWYHVAAVYDGTSMVLYLNGAAVGSMGKSGAVDSASSVSVNIGRNPDGSNYFSGALDDLRIYNRALTASEINGLASISGTPTVQITSPASGAHVSGTINVLVTATDDQGISRVEFLIDNAAHSSDTTNQYSASVDTTALANGIHNITARAVDTAGNVSTSTIQVDVQNADTTPPSTPTNPVASSVSASQIRISWGASTDAGGIAAYRVYRNGSLAGTTSSLSWTDSNLMPATTYSYRVSAVDNAGNESAQSATASATTAAAADSTPPTISGVTATNVSQNGATLTWATNEPADSQVEYGTSSAYGSSTPLNASPVTNHSVVLSGLLPATVYHYRVRSRDQAGNLAASGDLTFTTAAAQSGSDDDLTAHWTFDEGSGTTARDSRGSNNGTLHGATWSAGNAGGGLSFDGVDDYLSLPAMDVVGTGMTITAWVRFASFPANVDQRIVSKATDVSEQGHYWMLSETGRRLRFRLKTGNTTTTLIATSGDLAANTWYHVAAVYDGTSMRLYLNGTSVGSTAKTGTISAAAAAPVCIGRNPDGSNYFRGALDDVRIYKRGLSASEITALMQSN